MFDGLTALRALNTQEDLKKTKHAL